MKKKSFNKVRSQDISCELHIFKMLFFLPHSYRRLQQMDTHISKHDQTPPRLYSLLFLFLLTPGGLLPILISADLSNVVLANFTHQGQVEYTWMIAHTEALRHYIDNLKSMSNDEEEIWCNAKILHIIYFFSLKKIWMFDEKCYIFLAHHK